MNDKTWEERTAIRGDKIVTADQIEEVKEDSNIATADQIEETLLWNIQKIEKRQQVTL